VGSWGATNGANNAAKKISARNTPETSVIGSLIKAWTRGLRQNAVTGFMNLFISVVSLAIAD
jgi:hypothetical protein